MSRKDTYNILVTDDTKIEWLASRFIQDCHTQLDITLSRKTIKWNYAPSWAKTHYDPITLNCASYAIEKYWLNLYSFPSGIARNFLLSDLAINFDGVLFIIDMGHRRYWDTQVDRKKSGNPPHGQSQESTALAIASLRATHSFTDKEIIDILVHRTSAFGDPRRIWGLELVNQIKGVKLILAIKSLSHYVPMAYIREHLHLDLSIDVLEHTVNPIFWSDLNLSYSDAIIRNVLSILEQKIDGNRSRDESQAVA